MALKSSFDSPLLLGFDQIERVLDRVSRSANESYPPYNIERLGENALRITLAVAGFADENLSVTVEDNQLVIRGQKPEEDNREYLHRGIATRQFQRAFVLAEGIEVRAAHLDNGLLSIDLEQPPVETVVRKIDISSASRGAHGGEASRRDGNRNGNGSGASTVSAPAGNKQTSFDISG